MNAEPPADFDGPTSQKANPHPHDIGEAAETLVVELGNADMLLQPFVAGCRTRAGKPDVKILSKEDSRLA